MPDLLSKYPRHNPDAAGRILDGEATVVTPEDSMMHTLNAVGTWIWDHADGAKSVAELADALQEAFEVDAETARADTEAFVRELEGLGILVLDEAPAGGG